MHPSLNFTARSISSMDREIYWLSIVSRLIKYKVRAMVATNLIPHYTPSRYSNIAKMQGLNCKRGKINCANVVSACNRNPDAAIHYAILNKLFKRGQTAKIIPVENYLNSYQIYLEIFELTVDTAPVTFDEFWTMRVEVSNDQLAEIECNACHSVYLRATEFKMHIPCPFCGVKHGTKQVKPLFSALTAQHSLPLKLAS